MWDESIRLELMAAEAVKAAKEFKTTRDKGAFDRIYLDMRQEFPTLSEKELWELIGLCVKVYERPKND
ncbi:MAG: hypothetical protein K6G81_03290 [Lachnospiraceae bacterium]|nr:hypothetical protein [Lachnospiraceae bacterium]